MNLTGYFNWTLDRKTSAATQLDITPVELEVLALIAFFGKHGCIADNVLDSTNLGYGTVTPRFAKLVDKGLVIRTGETRIARSGKRQLVMRAV